MVNAPARLAHNLTLAFVVACGQSTPIPSPPDPTADCTRVLSQARSQLVACFSPRSPFPLDGDVATVCGRYAAKVKSGIVKYDSTQLDNCLADVAGFGCSPRVYSTQSFDSSAACASLFTGTIGANGACTGKEDCFNGRCDFTRSMMGGMDCPGHCDPSVLAPLGAACGAGCARGLVCAAGICSNSLQTVGAMCVPTEAECVPSAFCSRMGDVCTALGGIGAVCGDNGECLPSLRCISGACAQPTSDGASCTGFECASGMCFKGLCVTLVASKVGDSCGLMVGNRYLYCEGGWCNGTSQAPGLCQARVVVGGACTLPLPFSGDQQCASGAICNGRMCVPGDCE